MKNLKEKNGKLLNKKELLNLVCRLEKYLLKQKLTIKPPKISNKEWIKGYNQWRKTQ